MDRLALIDACCEAYDRFSLSRDVTGDGIKETFCNLAVAYVCKQLGYHRLQGMVANQMVEFLKTSTDWESVPIQIAQDYANQGRLLIAGQSNAPHGHVAVIRPGRAGKSKKWGVPSPKVCHVGASSCIGEHLGFAFSEMPGIWMLREQS